MADFKNHEKLTNQDTINDKLDYKEADIDMKLEKLEKENKEIKNILMAISKVERQKLIEKIARENQGREITKDHIEEKIKEYSEKPGVASRIENIRLKSIKKAREQIDKKLKNSKKLKELNWAGGLGDWIADAISYNIDEKMVSAKTMTKESFEDKYGEPGWLNIGGWFKSVIGGIALSFFGGDKLNKLVGQATGSIKKFFDSNDHTSTITAAGAGIATGIGSTIKEKEDEVLRGKKKNKGVEENILSKNNDKPNANSEVLDKMKENFPFKTGSKMIIGLSGIEITNQGTNLTKIYQMLKGKPLAEIKEIYNNKIKKREFLNKYENKFSTKVSELEKENLDDVLKIFFNTEDSDIPKYLNISMKFDYLDNIIKPNGKYNPKIKEYINESRLNDILKASKNGDKNPNWWHILTFEEISTLHFFSFPALGLLASSDTADVLGKIGSGIGSFITKGVNLENAEDFTDEIFPNVIIKTLAVEDDFGGEQLTKNDKELNKLFENKNLKENEKDKLEELISFKDYILGDFLEEDKLLLEESEKELFKKNIDYKWIIGLYASTGGIKDFKSISPTNKIITVLGVFEVLGSGGLNNKGASNSLAAGKYLTRYVEEMLNKDSKKFDDDEKAIFDIYKDRFFEALLPYNIKAHSIALGFVDEHIDKFMAGGLIGGGSALALSSMLLGNAGKVGKGNMVGLSKTKLFLGGALSKIGWVGLLIGGLSTARKFMRDDELSFKNQENEFNKMIESGSIEELIKYFKKLEASTRAIEIGSGEKMIISQWPNDSLVIYYKGKMYTPDILDTPKTYTEIIEGDGEMFGEKGEKLFNRGVESFKNLFKGEKTGKVKLVGKTFELGKGRMLGDKIVFGEGENMFEVEIKHISEKIKIGKITEEKGIIQVASEYVSEKLFDGENKVNVTEGAYDENNTTKYIPIKKYPNGRTLIFKEVQIGEES